jgi:hypothetical protein
MAESMYDVVWAALKAEALKLVQFCPQGKYTTWLVFTSGHPGWALKLMKPHAERARTVERKMYLIKWV